MFSLANANELREKLPVFDGFDGKFADPLLDEYTRHYGLQCDDFESMGGESTKSIDSPRPAIARSIGKIESAGFTIVVQHFYRIDNAREADENFPSSQGTIFLLHGYYDHIGLFGHIIRHCLKLNYNVLMFDLPGHGLSSGEAAAIDDFEQYVQVFIDCLQYAQRFELPRPWVAMGQSTGAAIILQGLQFADLNNRFHFSSYILLAPLLEPRHRWWGRLLFLFYSSLVKTMKRGFSRNSHDEKFLHFISNEDELQCRELKVSWVTAMFNYGKKFKSSESSNIALKIIQGSGDGTVDWKHNLRCILRKFPNSSVSLIAGAGHHLVNEAAQFREQVFSRIEQTLESSKKAHDSE